MKQSPLLEFASSEFAIIPGEDSETNPEIYGKALATWLSQQLRSKGIPAGEAFAEDFGWCVCVESSPHSLHVACANDPDIPDGWRVFAFAEGGIVARLLGRDRSAEAVQSLYRAIKDCVAQAPGVRDIREHVD
jgi:hypothetical protein